MWQVNTLPNFGKYIAADFNGLNAMLVRLRKEYGDNRVMIVLTAPENRVFDQDRLSKPPANGR